jgi:hypothetical protein
VVSLGFVMTFSPYQLELVLAFLYLALKAIYEVRLHKWDSETKLCKTCKEILIYRDESHKYGINTLCYGRIIKDEL